MVLVNPYAGLPFQTQLILHGAGAVFLWGVIHYLGSIEKWTASVINPEAGYFKIAFFAILYLLAVILLPTLGVEIYRRTQS